MSIHALLPLLLFHLYSTEVAAKNGHLRSKAEIFHLLKLCPQHVTGSGKKGLFNKLSVVQDPLPHSKLACFDFNHYINKPNLFHAEVLTVHYIIPDWIELSTLFLMLMLKKHQNGH